MLQQPILDVKQIEVMYGGVIRAINNVSLVVPEKSIVALLGANGAGKSTTLKAISGLLSAQRGEIIKGTIHYQGINSATHSAARLVNEGLIHVLEGRHCFPHLSVEENLVTGAFIHKPSRQQLNDQLEKVYADFPRLKKLRKNLAGYTSGGEQQMIAIGRALMAKPRLILLDEPSMGLAPQITEEIFDSVKKLSDCEGVSILVAEQNVTVALRYADYAYVFENGEVANQAAADEFDGLIDLASSYLGGAVA